MAIDASPRKLAYLVQLRREALGLTSAGLRALSGVPDATLRQVDVRMRRPMINERLSQRRNHGYYPFTGVSLCHGTSDADSPGSRIYVVPSQPAKLRDPHAGQYKGRHDGASRDVITVALVRPRSKSRGDGPWNQHVRDAELPCERQVGGA